jgi:hypothetical protein
MAVQHRGASPARLNTPYGRFRSGKSQSAWFALSTQLFIFSPLLNHRNFISNAMIVNYDVVKSRIAKMSRQIQSKPE